MLESSKREQKNFNKNQKTKSSLEKIKEELNIMLDNVPARIFFKDAQNRFIRVNKIFADSIGVPVKEIKGKSASDIYPKEQSDLFWKTDKEVIESGKPQRGLIAKVVLKGKERWVQTDKIPYRDENGKIIGVIGFSVDITDQKRRREDLISLNRNLSAINDSAMLMFKARDERKYLKEICKIIVQNCGHKMVWIGFADDNEEKTVTPVAWAGFTKGYVNKLKVTWSEDQYGQGPTGTAIRTGKPAGVKNIFIDPNYGPWRRDAIERGYASSLAMPMISSKGSVIGAINFYNEKPDAFSDAEIKLLSKMIDDLVYGIEKIRLEEEHTRKEAALRESEIRFRKLFEAAKDGMMIIDAESGTIMEVNPYLKKMFGYPLEEIVGKKLWQMEALIDTYTSKQAYRKTLLKGFAQYDNIPAQTKDGKLLNVEFVSNLYRANRSRIIQCSLRDITERKIAEAIAEQQRLFEEEKMKTDFIADATHEIRTPLAIIRGNIDLVSLSKQKLPKIVTDAIKAINHEIKHLTNMLSDLTLITSQDAEYRKIRPNRINLPVLLNRTAERCHMLAKDKNIKINVKKMPQAIINGDSMYIEKLFVNLIKNAVTYGKQDGLIVISAVKDNYFVHVSVSDDGLGISKEDQMHIFDRFYRVDKSRNLSGGNSGLGLAIVKWICESHGGSIRVSSVLGEGSIFTVSLPVTDF